MAQGSMAGSTAKTWEILLVEDNPGDVEMTKRILDGSRYQLNFNVTTDGEEAMAYLRKEGQYAGSPQPDLILLDLSLPKMSGYEVLDAMKASDNLKDIPVMILTSTKADRSRVYSQGFHPSRYTDKPIIVSQFERVLEEIQSGPAVSQESKKKWWWPFGS